MPEEVQPRNQQQGRKLTDEELVELRNGQAIEEMQATKGWKIVEGMLKDLAIHRWADPRETKSMKEWTWRELNTFYAANNAKELLDAIDELKARADDLDAVQKGEVDERPMKI